MSWLAHWGLDRDPFCERGATYVPLASHEEAVARLVHTIEAGDPLALLRASSGMGKSVVLGRAIAAVRDPRRRLAKVISPIDGGQLYRRLAEALGSYWLDEPSRSSAWLALERTVRTWVMQGFQVVLAVDEGTMLVSAGDTADLLHLRQLARMAGGSVTLVIVLDGDGIDSQTIVPPWTLAIGLRPLSCCEAEEYLTTKLTAAGSREAIFSQRAMTRLHVHSHGKPAWLDRLASLCLAAGASRRLEAISSDLVDALAGESGQPAVSALHRRSA